MDEVELLRMQLVACGVAAMSNTRSSMRMHRIPKGNPYWCVAYDDVCTAVEREIALREENEDLRRMLELIRDSPSSESRLLAKLVLGGLKPEPLRHDPT